VIAHVHDARRSVRAIVEEARPEVTFHLASLYLRETSPEQLHPLVAANITLGVELADALHRLGSACLVNVGTYMQFYDSTSPRPLNLYAAAKEALETVLAYYSDLGCPITTLILFDTYGPGDRRAKLVPQLFNALVSGNAIPLPADELVMDLTFRSDVVEAFVAAARGLEASPSDWVGRRFAVSGHRATIREVVSKLEEVVGREIPKRWGGWSPPARRIRVPWIGPRPHQWAAEIGLAEGLRLTAKAILNAR
jgi:nucleoside-diphosphate-sugar epimerase